MKKLILLIVAIILWRQVVPLGQLILNFRLNDFSVYLDGTRAALEGLNPYQLKFFDRFNYSPAATLFFIPLTLIPENTAEFVFTAISILSLFISIKIIFELLKIKISPSLFWLIFILALKTYPSKLTLVLGQMNLIILGLVVGSYYFCKARLQRPAAGGTYNDGEKDDRDYVLSGISLGLATILKLTPAPLIIYFLFRKKWKIILWSAITVIVSTLIGIAVFGWDLTYYYYFKAIPQLMTENTPETLNGSYMNQSVTALLGKFRIFGELNSMIRIGISGILTIFFVIPAYAGIYLNNYLYRFRVPPTLAVRLQELFVHDSRGAFRRASKPGMTRMTGETRGFVSFWNLAIIAMLFLPVFVWQHHYTILIPIWIILTAKFISTKKVKDLTVAGLTYFLLNFYIKDPYVPAQLNPFLSGHFLTTAIIFLLLSSYTLSPDQKQISDRKQFLK